jgi:hypothetical protein
MTAFSPHGASHLQRSIRHAEACRRNSYAAALFYRYLFRDVFCGAANLFQSGSRCNRSPDYVYETVAPVFGAGGRRRTFIQRNIANANGTGPGVPMQHPRENQPELSNIICVFALK